LYYIALTIPVKHTGVSIPQLTVPKVKEFLINVPSANVQNSIVAKLDAAKARCGKLKAAAERGLAETEKLRKAILAEAFEQ
jgi:type I restriction enzyme S subunit